MNKAFTRSVLPLLSCLVIWASVWALLPSRALGQVNGSGPSPSSDFDIVLNLPGDEAIITGADNESIGGTPGQTTQLNVHTGGVIGRGFVVSSGSELNIIGGNVGSFSAESGSVVNVSGGTVHFSANSGSVVNISGGTIVGPYFANSGSLLNISGGEFDDLGNYAGTGLFAEAGSGVNIFGSGFRIEESFLIGPAVELDDVLVLGQPVQYNVRTTVHLSTLLPDGNSFIISLDPYNQIPGGAFSREAGLALTLTAPAAEPVLLGDCNLDGVVDFEDIGPFIMALQSGSFLEEADCNQDGGVDFEDIGALVAILQNI